MQVVVVMERVGRVTVEVERPDMELTLWRRGRWTKDTFELSGLDDQGRLTYCQVVPERSAAAVRVRTK